MKGALWVGGQVGQKIQTSKGPERGQRRGERALGLPPPPGPEAQGALTRKEAEGPCAGLTSCLHQDPAQSGSRGEAQVPGSGMVKAQKRATAHVLGGEDLLKRKRKEK